MSNYVLKYLIDKIERSTSKLTVVGVETLYENLNLASGYKTWQEDIDQLTEKIVETIVHMNWNGPLPVFSVLSGDWRDEIALASYRGFHMALFTEVNGRPVICLDVAILSDISLSDRIGETIAHELVHYNQWLKGDLAIDVNNPSRVFWEGESWDVLIPNECNLVSYFNQPWEREAYLNSFKVYPLPKGMRPSDDMVLGFNLPSINILGCTQPLHYGSNN